jgi:hypothetical protein
MFVRGLNPTLHEIHNERQQLKKELIFENIEIHLFFYIKYATYHGLIFF